MITRLLHKRFRFTKCLILHVWVLIGFSFLFNVNGQSLSHPCIWVNTSEKDVIPTKISSFPWAANLNTQLYTRVDATKNSHKNNPATIINTMPAIGNSSTRDAHNQKVTMTVESATLYYLTGNEDYAQLSADILSYYAEVMSVKIKDITYIPMVCNGAVGVHLPVAQINANYSKIYPNPANQTFTIELGNDTSDVVIYNLLGKKVFEQHGVQNDLVMSTAQLGGSGLYSVKINGQTYKLVINNK